MTVVSLTNMISEGTQWAAAFPGCIAYARNATDAPQIPVNCRGTNSIIGRIINENTNLDLARVVNMSVTPVTAAPGDQVVITITYQLPTITPIFQSMFGRNLTLTAQSIELVRGTDVPTYPGGHTDQPPNLSPISPVSYVSYQCDHGNAKLTWAAVAGVSGYDIFQGPVTTHASASYSFSTTADPVVFPTTGVPGAGASAVLNITTFNDDGAGHFTLGTPYTLTVSCAVMKPLNSIAYSCQPHGATFTWNMPTNVGNSLDLAVSYYRIYYGGTSTQIGSNFAAVSNPQSASILFAANPPDGTRSYEIQAFDSFGNPAGPRSDPVTLGCLPHYADLALSLVGNPSPYVVRANQLVYTLTVTNGGALAATNVVMVDTLDPNEHFSSVSVVPSSPDCIYENPTLIPDVKCTFASMADGESKIITITVTAPDALTTITNSATVSSDLEDNDSSNNWRSITTTVTDPPDVAITMSGTPSVVAVGGSVTYTLTVTDGPEAPVGGLTVMTDPLPAGLTFGGCTPAPCNYISD